MRQNLSLHTKQLQQLKISPKLIQTLKIVHFPLNELAQFLQYELAENPFLQEKIPTEQVSFDEFNTSYSSNSSMPSIPAAASVSDIIEATAKANHYLQDDLLQQLLLICNKNSIEWKIGSEIIARIDNDGYFKPHNLPIISKLLHVGEENRSKPTPTHSTIRSARHSRR